MDANKLIKLKASAAENGATLIQFLADRFSVSRNRAKEIIDRRLVFVNGRRIWMARHRLEAEDTVTGCFDLREQQTTPLAPVIYEDDDYLIVDKPAGISSNGPNSVEQLLNRQSGNKSTAACHVDQARGMAPRVACHRLDKDTSGCLIFAKHHKAKERIISLFARNQIFKKYEAIVQGRFPGKLITITKPIDGQSAISRVQVVDSTPTASHVSISIETGRTHQIRKHLASIGHPVLGDQHYGVGREVPQRERLIGRQMLHAVEIKFIQPFTEKPVHGKTILPADIRDCLKQYRLK